MQTRRFGLPRGGADRCGAALVLAAGATRNAVPLVFGGELSRDQADDVGFGGMDGIMVEPWAGTRFGVTYISPVKLDFNDVGSANRLGPGLQALARGFRPARR